MFGAIIGFLLLAFNIVIPIWTGISIYGMTHHNVIFAIIGAFIVGGFGQMNPLILLAIFPAFEYFYSGKLTDYSFVYIALVLLNMLIVFIMMLSSKNKY